MDARHRRLVVRLAAELRGVRGVAAVVLGGSRARGTAVAGSDVDLGLYYRPEEPPDLDALRAFAARVDDAHRADVVTPIGGWGPWINGGACLTVESVPVDLLYRDLTDCIRPSWPSLPGEPAVRRRRRRRRSRWRYRR